MSAQAHTTALQVNDRWLFFLVYPLLALALVHTGNENSFTELLKIPSYYSDLLLAFGCVYAVGFYLRRMYRRLGERFGWEAPLRQYPGHILLFCFLLPLSIGIGLEIIYLVFLLDIPLSESPVFILELPVSAFVLALLNLIYSFLYYRAHMQQRMQLLSAEDNKEQHRPYRNSFLVYAGAAARHIPQEETAYFIIREKSVFLVSTTDGEFLAEGSLEEIARQLDPALFFQLNRQVIARRQSILSFEQTDTRKLSVQLFPGPGTAVFVSKARAAQFAGWLKKN